MPLFRIMTVRACRLLLVLARPLTGGDCVRTPRCSPAQLHSPRRRIRDIHVEGNRRVEPETVRSYLQFSVGDAYDAGKVDRLDQGAVRHRPVLRRAHRPRGRRRRRHRRREPGHQPGRLRGQQRGRHRDAAQPRCSSSRARSSRAPRSRPTCSASSTSIAARAASRRRSSPRSSSSSRDRVNLVFEINEGGATKVKGIHFIGNHAFSDTQLRDIITTTAAGLVRLPQGHGLLRSRPHESRSRAAAPVLPQERLCRRAGRRGQRRARSRRLGLLHHLRRSRKASSTTSATSASRAGLPASTPRSSCGEVLTEQGDTYNAAEIDKTVEQLTLAVSEQGFAFARVRPQRRPRSGRRA